MKHAFLKAAIAACFACAAVTVSAANPFTDVSADDWAYQAVASLSDEGVIDGYPDGTFRGDKHVTRYEIAQIVARLMAKEDTLNASQKETLAKLSSQYANELKDLGVRIAELEKKRGATDLITELRVQSIDRYDDVFKGKKHNEISTRVRLNTITPVNDRVHLYGQLETILDMNGKESYDVNRIDPKDKTQTKIRTGYGDGDFHLNRLWTTYHFGPKQDTTNLPYGPSKNLIGIGQFPVKMGVTGYTYDGEVKGVFASFGDYLKGGRLTLAFGRATNINYAYTGPMMRGVALKNTEISDLMGKAAGQVAYNKALEAHLSEAQAKAAYNTAYTTVNNQLNAGLSSSNMADRVAAANTINTMVAQASPELQKLAKNLTPMLDGENAFNYFPMDNVHMGWGDDEDVPVAYASYIYKKPGQWEVHAYGMKACGPVGHIAKAYGFAGSYNVTPMLRVQGEFVKNLRKLPLNNERPYSYNYGIHYGEANVLKAKSFSIGVDYVYSQAGTYFGGSSNDIVDQYMGHVYSDWRGRKMPAYFADKLDATLNGTDSPDKKYGGAKFYLAKASFVPMRGLLVEANYGFNAKDMGGKKMDNMFMLKATAYIK